MHLKAARRQGFLRLWGTSVHFPQHTCGNRVTALLEPAAHVDLTMTSVLPDRFLLRVKSCTENYSAIYEHIHYHVRVYLITSAFVPVRCVAYFVNCKCSCLRDSMHKPISPLLFERLCQYPLRREVIHLSNKPWGFAVGLGNVLTHNWSYNLLYFS